MAEWVIDTNVLLVATRAVLGSPPRKMARRGEDVPVEREDDQRTVFLWVKNLRETADEVLVLDRIHNLIYEEYANKLEKDEYGRMVVAHKLTLGECRFVEIEMDSDGDALIQHEACGDVFDHDDRKMVAAAIEANAPIANACDAGWCELEQRGSLDRLGITVHHLIEAWCRALWEKNRDHWSNR